MSISKKMVRTALAEMLILVMLCGCEVRLDTLWREESRWSDTSGGGVYYAVSRPEVSYEVTDTMEVYPYSVKNTLDENQTELYNRMSYQIENGDLSFDFENTDNDTFRTSYYAVLYDHPEYFWLGQNYTYSVRTMGDYSLLHVEPECFSSESAAIASAKARLQAVTDRVVSEASSLPTLYERVLYVHDYLIDHTVYDHQTLEKTSAGNDDEFLTATTAYGCLVEQKAVCSGYAAAFELIMHKLGIECGLVNGTRTAETGPHQWNYVGLNGEYYYIDVTWDDPLKDDGSDSKTYEFFLISEEDLADTHRKDDGQNIPQCLGTRCNYYRYNDWYFDEYDFRLVRDAAERQRDSGSFTVKFASAEQLQQAVEELLVSQRIFELDFISDGVSYSVSSSGKILTVVY